MCLEPHAQPARRLVSRQGSWAPRAFTGFRSPHGRLLAESPRQSLASGQLWPHLEEVWQSPGPPAPQPPASELQLISARRRLGLQEPAGPRLTALSPGVGEAGRGVGHWARASSSRNHITGGPKQRPQRRRGLAHPRCKRLFFLHEVPDASVLGMVIVTLRCQTPRPGRGLHTCDRPFVPTHLGHPPAQTDRCGWLRVGVSGISDQEI